MHLDVGQTVYINHDKCGDTRRRLGITKFAPNLLVHHCFNCNSTWKSGDKSFAGQKIYKPREPSIPKNAEFNYFYWPKEAKDWVGSLLPEAVQAKFYYDPNTHRIVCPMFDSDGLLWTNARALDKEDTPKYLMRKMGRMGTTTPEFVWGKGKRVILTEDTLSAMTVGRDIEDGIGFSCMGAKVSPSHVESLKNLAPESISIFFDNDNADVKKSQVKAKKLLEFEFNCPVNIVRNDKDPKECSREELKDLLNV